MATVEERFWEKVCPEPNSGCWLWTGALDKAGYGRIFVAGVNTGAHRIGYELSVGPIPDGLHLDHLCKTRCCVNPKHLEAVTPVENLQRGGAWRWHAGRTHCVDGHAFEKHGFVDSTGRRQCRVCMRRRSRESYHRRKGA